MQLANFWKYCGILCLMTGFLLCLYACKHGKTISQVEQMPTIEIADPVTKTVVSDVMSLQGKIISMWIVEDPPLFDGKPVDKEFSDYVNKNFVRTSQMDGISGRVIVNFFINTDGSVSEAKMLRGVHPLLDVEALRLVKSSSSRWTPAKQCGKPVRLECFCSVSFRLTAE